MVLSEVATSGDLPPEIEVADRPEARAKCVQQCSDSENLDRSWTNSPAEKIHLTLVSLARLRTVARETA